MQYVDKLASWYEGFAERAEARGVRGSQEIAKLIKLASILDNPQTPTKVPVPPAGTPAPLTVQTKATK